MIVCIILNCVVTVVFMVVVSVVLYLFRKDRKTDALLRAQRDLQFKAELARRDKQFADDMTKAQAECHAFHSLCVDKMVAAFKTMGNSLDENTKERRKDAV